MNSIELADHITEVILGARQDGIPFPHIKLSGIVPKDFYEDLVESFPRKDQYRPLMVRGAKRRNGTSTRGQFLLTDQNILTLEKRADLWSTLRNAFTSQSVRDALENQLEVPLMPKLTYVSLFRDEDGYRIKPHPDIPDKVVTLGMYLPNDDSQRSLGTNFHKTKDSCGEQIEFLKNTGYAFRVTKESWHSVDVLPRGSGPRNVLLSMYCRKHMKGY